VGGTIDLNFNPALTSLDGLAGITSVGGDLVVQGHAALNNCAALAPILGFPVTPYSPAADSVAGTVTMAFNGVGANSPDDCLNAYARQFAPVPTTQVWAMLLLMLLIASNGAVYLRRH